jgi:hypothetical protein
MSSMRSVSARRIVAHVRQESLPKSAPKSKPQLKPTQESKPKSKSKPKLLSGGNPQIAKADGDAPVQAYIAAMPGWKRDLGRQLDALIMQAVPGACKAVKWNSPLYFHIYEGEKLDTAQFASWAKQASKLPGWGKT